MQSAFTHGSVRGSIYVEGAEGLLDVDTISLLNSTPGIIWKQSGIVCQSIDPFNWVKLLTMQDPMTVVKAGQWIRVCTRVYKGDVGFVKCVEPWGAQVLVVPCLKTSTPEMATSLKRKQNSHQARTKVVRSCYLLVCVPTLAKTSTDWNLHLSQTRFDHGLLQLNLDLPSTPFKTTVVNYDDVVKQK
jgi:hypothetical protein